jgi:excisionase family DNA binding protein
MVRKGSPVRVRQRASGISRAFFSHAPRAPTREVPSGYILAALDGHAAGPWAGTEGGQLSRSVLFFYVSTSTRDAAFLRPSEAAELAGLSTRAIYRAIERGELRAAKLCSRLRIPCAAFEEWVEACAVKRAEGDATVYPRVPPPASGSFRALLAGDEERSS